MSALLVTSLCIAMISQIAASAISNQISEDPVVLAQEYLDNSQNTVTFTKSKNLENVINYLKSKNFDASNVIAYSNVEIDNQFLDIPFSIDLSQGAVTNTKSFVESKKKLLSTIKISKQDKPSLEAPTEIDLGDVILNVKDAQAISGIKLDETIIKMIEIAITKVSFTAKSNNPTIQSFEKSNNKILSQKKSALNKFVKVNDINNKTSISDKDIESEIGRASCRERVLMPV